MTILGCLLVDRDRAIIWSDTEIFVGTEPTGHSAKVFVNCLGFCVLGCGSLVLARAAEEICAAAMTLDEVVDKMPRALRAIAAKIAPNQRDYYWFANATVIAVGFSDRLNRLMGFRFSGTNFLSPVMTSRVVMPSSDVIGEAWGVHRVEDAVRVARQQMVVLREALPTAHGGALTVVELRRDCVGLQVFRDFDAEVAAPELVEPIDAVETAS
jgi:hypothetical protein